MSANPDPAAAPKMPRWLRVADRAAAAVAMGLNVAGTLLIVAVAVLVNADVIGRGAFAAPVSGVPELVALSIVAIVFLQVAEAARRGRFIRSDAIPTLLAARAPRLGAALEALWHALALGLIVILAAASWPPFLAAWERQSFVGAVGHFTAPVWPIRAIILIGCIALALQFALGLARALLRLTARR